jgi:hypothetical protein
MGICREHCHTSNKKALMKKKRHDLDCDPYAKRTAGRVVATPASKSDRVGPAPHPPRAGACRLWGLLARAPRRHRWSTIPARLWRNHSAAHLNLSPSQWRWLTKSTPTPNFGNRFMTTCGSNIPNGSSQMANPRCVILTRRASWNCSWLRHLLPIFRNA